MVTRILKQVKVFDIKSHSDTINMQGWSDHIPGLTWVNGQTWENDAECERCLQSAIDDWEYRRKNNPWGTTSHKPELVIYWQTFSVKEEQI